MGPTCYFCLNRYSIENMHGGGSEILPGQLLREQGIVKENELLEAKQELQFVIVGIGVRARVGL